MFNDEVLKFLHESLSSGQLDRVKYFRNLTSGEAVWPNTVWKVSRKLMTSSSHRSSCCWKQSIERFKEQSLENLGEIIHKKNPLHLCNNTTVLNVHHHVLTSSSPDGCPNMSHKVKLARRMYTVPANSL